MTKKAAAEALPSSSSSSAPTASSSSSTLYLRAGKRFKTTNTDSLVVYNELPLATYAVAFDSCANCFCLDTIDDFDVTHKVYGKATTQSERILKTFESRSSSTGVLLAGEKGSGKTLLAKLISIKARKEYNMSTIIVSNNWCGENFDLFVQSITQPVVMLFDEFEKVYQRHQNDDGQVPQQKLLTLFDGVYPSKKLFVLTCNDMNAIDTNFRNRPGRLYYMLRFDSVDADFIREYCNDKLNDKSYINNIVSISSAFRAFNFDMLKAMVEEMNRYKESPQQVMEYLNTNPQAQNETDYSYRLFLNGIEIDNRGNNSWYGNPLNQEILIYYDASSTKKSKSKKNKNNDMDGGDDDDVDVDNDEDGAEGEEKEDDNEGNDNDDDDDSMDGSRETTFSQKDLVELRNNMLVFVNEKNERLEMKPKPKNLKLDFAKLSSFGDGGGGRKKAKTKAGKRKR